jgi:cobalt-zinc-cadmium efflux system protein
LKTERNILIAFALNLAFAIFEFVGGVFTNSVAIMSDAIHDIGDALSIGVSYWLEKKSKQRANNQYTYGYVRYSIIGGAFTTLVLMVSSCFVVYNAVSRLLSPEEINYNGMIVFAIIGVAVNAGAAITTSNGGSLNQRAVSLHMLEDVAGWIVVLVGAIIMRFTNIKMIDAMMSIVVATSVCVRAGKTFIKSIQLLSEKSTVSADNVANNVKLIDGVIDVHHIHVWDLNETERCATMHVLVSANYAEIKKSIREKLREIGINHSTLELEGKWEVCREKHCNVEVDVNARCACHEHHK